MASLESLLTRSYAAQPKTGRTEDDLGVALEIVPISAESTRSVTLTSATNLVLVNAGVTLTCTFATDSTTLGALVDRINTSAHFQARIIDGLRATTTADSVLIPNSAITSSTINGETVYKVLIDTDVHDEVYYRVAMDRGVLRDDFGNLKTEHPLGSHRVKITGIKYKENISAATLNGLRIYEFNPNTLTETQIWGTISVDNTVTTHDFTDNPITSDEGNELVVMFADSAITTGALTNFLEVNYIRE